MVNMGYDYVAQIGSVLLMVVVVMYLVYLHKRLFKPMIEKNGMIERVKMALYDKELSQFCNLNKIDYSKIDIDFEACYKKTDGKLKARLKEIEEIFE